MGLLCARFPDRPVGVLPYHRRTPCGEMVYVHDGSDDLVEIAEWTLDEATDVLTLTISGTEDEEYAEPIEWVFDAGGDTLTATEWDTDLYGEDAPVMEMVEE